MRGSLKWTLVGTGIASAIALWIEPSDREATTIVIDARGPTLSAPAAASDPFSNWRDAVTTVSAGTYAAAAQLLSQLPDRDMEAGVRDIFTPVTPPPPPSPPPPAPAPPSPPPPPPAQPPMNWRAIGSMVTPDGQRIVWLAKGTDEIRVTPGTRLDDGYVVQSVDEESVVLLYPPIGTTARITLPHAQAGSP